MKHVLGFSGGVDSQACARWLLNRYPAEDVILLFSDAGGWEDPITPAFVEEYSAKVHPVIKIEAVIADMWATPGFTEKRGIVSCPDGPHWWFNGNAKLDFVTMCHIKGRAPSRKAQFCTEKLKLVPQKRWCEQHLADVEFERYTGVRRDESQNRRNAQLREWDNYFDCWVNNPICDWNKQKCFDYVKDAGEEVNPLYKMGFGRVGCAPCINSGKDDILLWLLRRPAAIDKVRELERVTGKTYFAPCVPGMVMNFIDDVIVWAQTDRGGRQANMLKILNERPACESKYGLCE